MTDQDARMMEIFMDVQAGLPRQGPGDDASTGRALAMCEGLPAQPLMMDVGCGPGMQTRFLTAQTGGTMLAVDYYPVFLRQLVAESAPEIAASIHVVQGDMHQLPVSPASLDLIWSEGAAYIMGFNNALATWRDLLKPGGYLALSELTWLQRNPSQTVADFWAAEYPAMQHIDDAAAQFGPAGYDLIGHFTVPYESWFTHYYTPLSEKLSAMRDKYAGDELAAMVIDATATEIQLRRDHPDAYGYQFYIARRTD